MLDPIEIGLDNLIVALRICASAAVGPRTIEFTNVGFRINFCKSSAQKTSLKSRLFCTSSTALNRGQKMIFRLFLNML